MTPELLLAVLAAGGGLSLLVALIATAGPVRAPARAPERERSHPLV